MEPKDGLPTLLGRTGPIMYIYLMQQNVSYKDDMLFVLCICRICCERLDV